MTTKKANLFTFVLDYRGGTYISQIQSSTPLDAFRRWTDVVDLDAVFGLTKKSRDRFREGMSAHQVVPVDGVDNVWCTSGRVRGAVAVVHVIQTTDRGGVRSNE